MYYFGSIQFRKPVETPTSEQYGSSHTWSEIKPAKGKPILQDKGDNLVDLNLEMYLHISFCNPAMYIAKIFQMKSEGQICPYYHDNGEFRGNFVIFDITVNTEKRFPDGSLMSATVSLQLKQFSDAQFLKIVQGQYAEPALVDPNQYTDPAPLGAAGDENFDMVSLKDITRRP